MPTGTAFLLKGRPIIAAYIFLIDQFVGKPDCLFRQTFVVPDHEKRLHGGFTLFNPALFYRLIHGKPRPFEVGTPKLFIFAA